MMKNKNRILTGKKNYYYGLLAEYLVCIILKLKFYNIIAKRFRNIAGEVDIIATRGKTIVFVEVKSRSEIVDLFEIVSKKQRDRIIRSAELFIAQNTKYSEYDIRFDLVLMNKFRPTHMQNAWGME